MAPSLRNSQIGVAPDFESEDIDPIIAIAKDLSDKDKINRELNLIIESGEGVELARKQAWELFDKLEKKALHYTEKTDLNFNFQKDSQLKNVIVNLSGYSVSLNWSQAYSNSARDSKLKVTNWVGHLVLNSYNSDYIPGEEPKRVAESDYTVDLNEEKEIVWRKHPERTDTTEDILKKVFTFLIKAIKSEKEKTFRK